MIRLLVIATLTALLGAHPLAQSTTAPAASAKAAPIVNLNTASLVELQTLPGIGQKTAARIVEFREKNGPFKKIEELMNVQGIGEKVFLKLRAQLTVAAKGGEPAAAPK